MAPELQNLKESNEFLNLLLDNINSAVLIADENLHIHQFNNSFLNLFDTAAECTLETGFGEASGCVQAILENKPCGETSQCADCILRRSLLHNMDERNVGLYMLDVCGHGVPAALISVAVSQFLNSTDGLLGNNCELLSPEIVLNKLDHSFPFERFDSFFSIIYMTIDIKEGWLDYSCAGHPSPILLRSDGTMDFLNQRGPIIGFGSETPFGQSSIQLQAGDRIILYTDGLIESRNTAGDYFGKPGLYDVLANHRNEPIQDMVDAVYAKIKDFRQQAALDDDISLLALEYNGSQQLNYTV